MSHRRYVNLVTANHRQRIYSLRRLNGDIFFYPANEAAAKARDLPRLRRVPPHYRASSSMSQWKEEKKHQEAFFGQQLEGIIRPPRPIFSIRPTTCPTTYTHGDPLRLFSFPLSGTKIFFADSGARTTLYDTEARCVINTPCLHERKNCPVALSIPSPGTDGEQDQDGGSGSLYIMDTHMALHPKSATPFEALIWRGREDKYFTALKTWHCDALPQPPFFDHRPGQHTSVLSYAVVGDVICVSQMTGACFGKADVETSTYCFDTVSRTWSLAGDWQMPFSGKAEYVPELKLWFGASADNNQLPCAADLSPVPGGRPPKKRHIWGDPHLPRDWLPDLFNEAKIVSLGSGRFCIINSFRFRDMENIGCCLADEPYCNPTVIFSGLQVLAGNSNGNDSESCKESSSDSGKRNGLRMIKHKSRLCRDTDTHSLEAVL